MLSEYVIICTNGTATWQKYKFEFEAIITWSAVQLMVACIKFNLMKQKVSQ